MPPAALEDKSRLWGKKDRPCVDRGLAWRSGSIRGIVSLEYYRDNELRPGDAGRGNVELEVLIEKCLYKFIPASVSLEILEQRDTSSLHKQN